MVEPTQTCLLANEEFLSDSSSNLGKNMMNIPDDDEEVPSFGPKNAYDPKVKKSKKK